MNHTVEIKNTFDVGGLVAETHMENGKLSYISIFHGNNTENGIHWFVTDGTDPWQFLLNLQELVEELRNIQ